MNAVRTRSFADDNASRRVALFCVAALAAPNVFIRGRQTRWRSLRDAYNTQQ